jgi:carbon-monoxide dehydrogenase large subunit
VSASGIGDPVERTEDPAFITGQATYTDDIEAPRALHAAVLGSQYGHAQLNDIDTAAAEAVDGVEAVFTAESMAAEGRTPPPRKIPSISTDYIQVSPDLFRPVIAKDRVRY